MTLEQCTEFLKKVEVDDPKVRSLVNMAKKRNDFIKSIIVTKENVSFIFDGYYEVVKELLVAILLKDGWKSQNHQCLFTYFYKNYGYDAEVNIIKLMSYLRNRLDYYGEAVEYDYFMKNYKSFDKIINLLLGLIKK